MNTTTSEHRSWIYDLEITKTELKGRQHLHIYSEGERVQGMRKGEKRRWQMYNVSFSHRKMEVFKAGSTPLLVY